MLNYAEVFENAAKLIEKHGWLNGVKPLESGCHCLWTATVAAAGMTKEPGGASQAGQVLGEQLGVTRASDVFKINDSQSEEWAIAKLREIAGKFKE